ncbi:MAG: hypothetical protein ACRDSP_02760 [Pseudonocardiaceae bacterium]
MILWWIGDLILLFVVFPIVVVLVNRIVNPIGRIRVTVDSILENGVELTGELDNVAPLLEETDETVKQIAIGATRYVTGVGQLLGS